MNIGTKIDNGLSSMSGRAFLYPMRSDIFDVPIREG